MAADLHAAAYLVDGVPLVDTGVALTHDGSGLYDGAGEELSVVTSPGAGRGTISGGQFRPFTLSTMFNVQAQDADATWAAIRALRRRCKPGRTVTLTRQMPDPEGSDANVDHTTTARRQGPPRVEWVGNSAATVDLDWLIADSPWHGDALTVAASGTPSLAGDIPTYRMIVTLPAGPARYVFNDTTDHWLLFYAVVPSGGVEIDVEAQTATAITGGTDLSQHLSWGKAQPMRLDPGANALGVTDGTASIDYQPAYL